jgi:2-hydroxy-3-oxopropionate reductase
MAGHLLAADYPLTVYSRTKSRAGELLSRGAKWADAPADAAKNADVVFICVTDTPDVQDVILGERGVIKSARKGMLVVDHSTISPSATRQMAKQLCEKGTQMLDAPVSGGEIGAVSGTLSIMVGGDADAFEKVKPILDVMGNPEKVVRIGEAGAGQLCKVCNQMVIAGTLGVVAEAFALAKKSGIDASKMREALLGGFAASRVLEVHGERILNGNFKPGFKTKLFAKDLKIAAATLVEHQVAAPILAVAQQEISARMAAGAGEEDYSGMAKVVLELARLD